MASKEEGVLGKKRQKHDESSDDSSSYESDNEDMASDESFDENMEIPVEFEAFPPAECDFKAMKNLLKQLFLKDLVDLSELADLVISQEKIGSIIKVVDDDEQEEDYDNQEQATENGPSTSNNEDYEEEILGLITVLDLLKYKEKKCIQQIKKLLLDKCKACDDKTNSEFKDIINGNKGIGLLISERFINIPPQVALPLYKALRTELQHHYKKDKSASLDYLLIISKSYIEKEGKKSNSSTKKGKKSAKKEKKALELNFSNAEDEVLYKESVLNFSYPAQMENNDTMVGGKWSFDDVVLEPYRTVMIIPYKELSDIIGQLESLLVG